MTKDKKIPTILREILVVMSRVLHDGSLQVLHAGCLTTRVDTPLPRIEAKILNFFTDALHHIQYILWKSFATIDLGCKSERFLETVKTFQ